MHYLIMPLGYAGGLLFSEEDAIPVVVAMQLREPAKNVTDFVRTRIVAASLEDMNELLDAVGDDIWESMTLVGGLKGIPDRKLHYDNFLL